MIKVCGMREAENIREVEALGIDLMGFIFWPKSKRFISAKPGDLPTRCKRVGVFVDQMPKDICKYVYEYRLDMIQLHGNESPTFIEHMRASLRDVNPNIKIIKAINIASKEDLVKADDYQDSADCLLFDTKGKSVGGNGLQFDWDVLKEYKGKLPFLLSGGIDPEDANKIKAFHHDKFIGIDLNSRFESEPGIKNIEKLKEFIEEL